MVFEDRVQGLRSLSLGMQIWLAFGQGQGAFGQHAIVCFESIMERLSIDALGNKTAGFVFHIDETLNLCGKRLEKSKLAATVTVDWVEQQEAQQGAGAVESGGCCAIV